MPATKISPKGLEELLEKKRIAELSQLVAHARLEDLAQSWSALKPLSKLAVFKLLSPERAIEFYDGLSFDERYFVFSGFSAGSIAPLLESLPPLSRKRFAELPRWHYEHMLDGLLREAATRP